MSFNKGTKNGGAALAKVGLTLGALFIAVMLYFDMPTLSASSSGVYFTLLMGAAIATGLMALGGKGKPLALVVCLVVAFFGIMIVTTAPVFHADRYYQLLGQHEVKGDLANALPTLEYSQAPFVSEHMAVQAMQKSLSGLQAGGSQVELSEPVKQLVDGKLVWVSFLEHRGFFKWLSDGHTPGYAIVSAHNPSDVKLVTELDGKPLAMRYLPSAFGSDNVLRRAYFGGLASVGMTDFTAEIDDHGRPFYVATLYENTIGFSGRNAIGAATIDVQTGEVQRYKLADVPAWVDRVQPEKFIREQMADRGEYPHGYFNVSDSDRLRIADDLDLVYGSDKRAYWVGSMTSKGNNTGVSGFYLIDSRTKAVRWFNFGAVTQRTAANRAETLVRAQHLTATNALPFMVAGVPTYMMALQDSEGAAVAFALADMKSGQTVVVGDTLNAALRGYLNKRSTDKFGAEMPGAAALASLDGVVVRVASEFRNTQTTYYVTLKKGDQVLGNIFAGNSDLSEELVLTQPGDHVTLTYQESGARVIGIASFKNRDIPGVPVPK